MSDAGADIFAAIRAVYAAAKRFGAADAMSRSGTVPYRDVHTTRCDFSAALEQYRDATRRAAASQERRRILLLIEQAAADAHEPDESAALDRLATTIAELST